MQLRRRAPKDITASIENAVRAREDAAGRLKETRDLIAVQGERARSERVTIIAAIKKMRETNNLAGLILDDVEKGTGADGDAGTAGG
jgi:hypothetical protein